MDLPKEIKQSIAAYLDDKSVLNIRLIDKKWFNSIKNIHFPIFMPRSETLPLIVKSFSLYNTPISLTIHKPVRIPLYEFIQQVAKLSNLTSLTFPYFSDFEHDPSHRPSHPNQPEWHLLTNLTNLREITLLNPNRIQEQDQLSAPEGFLRALVHLPHLATLQLTNCNYSGKILDEYVPLLTKLEDFSAPMIPSVDLLPSMSPHLTRLCFSLPHKVMPVAINELGIFHNLKVLQLLGLKIQHLSLTEISSLVTLEVSASRVTGLDNNTKLRHLLITAHDNTLYDQIRKLPNLEWLYIDMRAKNKDPFFFNEFNKLTYLYINMKHNYEMCNISSSVKTLDLELELIDFNYASLAVLTSLDTLTVGTMYCHMNKDNYLADISTLTGLTKLTVVTYDHLTLANLSTLTNLERFTAGSCLSIELSFLSHLTKLRAFSNNKLQEEHYSEIAMLTRLTHLACMNYSERNYMPSEEDEDSSSDEQCYFTLLSHLPLKIFAAEVLLDNLNSFLQTVSTMTTLELLKIINDNQKYNEIETPADLSLLSSLTRLTRFDFDIGGLTSDALTPLTRVTSLRYLSVKKPEEDYDDDYEDEDQEEGHDEEDGSSKSEDEDNGSEPKHELDEWAPLLARCPNLISVTYTDTPVYRNPSQLDEFEDE